MSYAAAIDQLSTMAPELFTQPGHARRKFSLDEIGTLLTALENPHRRYPSVLIAGTNGKGSTASTLASILAASGLRTGLYTSPHLTRPNERIRINGAEISDGDFAALYFRIHDKAEQLVGSGHLAQHPSFFETLTAMALLHFADVAVDIAVLEVGMGGRLDATNIVEPAISIVTDISLDHTEWLGSTISAIAREKAGILHANGTLVTLPQHPAANQVLGEVANERNVRGVSAVPYMPPLASEGDRYSVDVLGATIEIASPLHGAHQHRNIALAIAAAVELAEQLELPITPSSIAKGVRTTEWPGRLEPVTTIDRTTNASTQWVLDVAHNPGGAWALRAGLRAFLASDASVPKQAVLVFSCLRDKPIDEMAQILFPLFDQVIFAPIHSARATPMADMLAAAKATGTPATAAASVAEALELASSPSLSREAQPVARVVIVAGSVYLVGEARALLLARLPHPAEALR
ncbi:MAG TPA: folylpolyglutamate synthase/dihydrofolate synthase family protein [Terracidiphilus sp.]|jgi:dihydrofolate synthase/folylpolyglutamate synthase|nr:folylpolyglutamate synthase/dihydrofolate synthase family protein [Terracidiphilus sp.]